MQLTRLRIAQPAGAPVICLAVPVSGYACIWLWLYLAVPVSGYACQCVPSVPLGTKSKHCRGEQLAWLAEHTWSCGGQAGNTRACQEHLARSSNIYFSLI